MSGADFWENSLFGLFLFFPLETLLKTVPFHPQYYDWLLSPLSTFYYPFSRIHLKRDYTNRNREDRVEIIKVVSIKVVAILRELRKVRFINSFYHHPLFHPIMDNYFMENSIHPIKHFREEIKDSLFYFAIIANATGSVGHRGGEWASTPCSCCEPTSAFTWPSHEVVLKTLLEGSSIHRLDWFLPCFLQ